MDWLLIVWLLILIALLWAMRQITEDGRGRVFDRMIFEENVKSMTSCPALMQQAESISIKYTRGELSRVEYEEGMQLIRAQMQRLEAIKKAIKE